MNGANDAGGVDLAGAMGNLNLNTPPPPRCGTCPNRTFTDAHALSQHCAATGHPPLHGEGPNSVMRTFCIQCPTRVFLTRAAAQSHATARDHTIEDRPVSRRERAIDDFFAQFPSFPYRPELPYFRQFNTLASEMGWGRRNPHRNEFRLAMAEAFGSDFNASTDEEAERLEVWQNLYRAVAENPDDVPEDIAGCKEVRSEFGWCGLFNTQ